MFNLEDRYLRNLLLIFICEKICLTNYLFQHSGVRKHKKQAVIAVRDTQCFVVVFLVFGCPFFLLQTLIRILKEHI